MARIRCLAARNFNHGRVTLRITIGDESNPTRWSYEVTFTAEPRGLHRPILKKEIVTSEGQELLARPSADDKIDAERMTQTHLEQVNANRDFRPIVEFLRSIRYLHLVPHLIRDPERGADRIEDPYGADFLFRIAETPEKTRLRAPATDQRGLRVAVPQLDELERWRQDNIGRWHLEARYKHWRPSAGRAERAGLLRRDPATHRAVMVVAGRGRKSGGPVLLEEPELSLHSSVVRQLPTILSRVRRAGGPSGSAYHPLKRSPCRRRPRHTDEVVILKPGEEGTEAHTVESVPPGVTREWTEPCDILSPLTEPDAAGATEADQPEVTIVYFAVEGRTDVPAHV